MRPAGVMDSAPDYGSGGSRFESWVGRNKTFVLKDLLLVWN